MRAQRLNEAAGVGGIERAAIEQPVGAAPFDRRRRRARTGEALRGADARAGERATGERDQ